jgi:hypothetical protein
MTKLGPEAIEYRISEAEAVLAFAETLTLVPAEAAIEVPDEARRLYEDLDPAYFDTILVARGDNRVLLSDDRPFRALATEAIGVCDKTAGRRKKALSLGHRFAHRALRRRKCRAAARAHATGSGLSTRCSRPVS